ncbi:nuclear protein export factor [Encephalitozoon romaleae SJ-2008]|uniref:Nuclear protein export factor n=1 Tax=Encephalitozoon romaleae (strain SJ-2008) TaxID=1178016 RepID=I6ZTC3_ENCRO|nr:nuclear protein export factor [Encephalitozoon romaleae SJ-2008]AFN82891.1 nuclear protein export factor [Encephalitozoon romaleae SJ-2008]
MEDLRTRYERLLEARKNAKTSENMVGECMTFCPELEGLERVLNNDVSPYETEVMIKKYRKVSSETPCILPEDIRPMEVLLSVINHVIRLCASDQSLQMYRFAENRTRAIISDMKIQGERGKDAIEVLEKIVRFYIVFRYLLYDHPHFNKDMNLGQLKVVMDSLVKLYDLEEAGWCEKDRKEEFYCYHIIATMGERCPFRIQRWDDGPRVRLSMEITRKYMQKNGAGFFKLLRKLDCIAFCLAQSFAGEVRARCIQMFRKSLAEKVSIEFLEDILWARGSEAEEFLRRNGIVVKSGKADFEERRGGEEYEKEGLYSRRIEINIKRPEMFMLHGCVDYRILSIILSALLWKKLRDSKLTSHAQCPQSQGKYHSMESRAVVRKMCVVILEEVVKKIAVQVFSRVMLLNTLKGYLIKWKELAKRKHDSALDENKYLLLIILDKEIPSVSFIGCINTSVLKSLAPVITYIEKVSVDEMLMYNLCVFSTLKNKHEELYARYRMINLIVGTPQSLSRRVHEIYERAVNASKTKKSTLFTLIDGMNKVQTIETIVKLIDNGKNGDIMERNLALLYEGKPLIECDVYYEEGRTA